MASTKVSISEQTISKQSPLKQFHGISGETKDGVCLKINKIK